MKFRFIVFFRSAYQTVDKKNRSLTRSVVPTSNHQVPLAPCPAHPPPICSPITSCRAPLAAHPSPLGATLLVQLAAHTYTKIFVQRGYHVARPVLTAPGRASRRASPPRPRLSLARPPSTSARRHRRIHRAASANGREDSRRSLFGHIPLLRRSFRVAPSPHRSAAPKPRQPTQVFNIHPPPSTQHPTPSNQHPTSYSLPPTTYTVNPSTFTLHPPPSTLHPPQVRGWRLEAPRECAGGPPALGSCSGSEAGSYLGLIDFCITQL